MSVFFFREGANNSISFEFAGREGRRITIRPGTYSVICYNSDSGAHGIINEDSFYDFGLHLHDVRRIGTQGLPPALFASENDERIANTPDEMWVDAVERIEISASPEGGVNHIVLHPKPAHSYVHCIVHDPENATGAMSIFATLSGMAGTIHPGRGVTGEETVTHSFNMSMTSGGKVEGRLNVFGHCSGNPYGRADDVLCRGEKHILTLYCNGKDNELWYKSFDVTDQIHSQDGQENILVELDHVDFPIQPSGGGGFIPSVNDWNVIIIPITGP